VLSNRQGNLDWEYGCRKFHPQHLEFVISVAFSDGGDYSVETGAGFWSFEILSKYE
jgi:hypothetical protein